MNPHGMLPKSLPPMHPPPMPPMSRADAGMAGMFFGASAAGQAMSHSTMLGATAATSQHGLGQPGGPSYHPSLLSLPPSVSDLTSGVLSNSC